MRVTKPNWVKHTDEKDRKSPIFSLSVHPDGTRLATGGLDRKVKIWSTLPILDSAADADEANHKLLCTMSSHTGSVLAVRWAHHGRFLASGSDDTVIVIWGIDPDGGGRVFGSDEVNVENWKALTRLVGHTADIIDIAWSRDDSMMASVGLDKMVNIWDGYTFERLRKLDLHGDFVKGVCWDPVGNYLATQSDDKTVKVWDTETWALTRSIAKPFERSPKSTFFRRLSWSPDGAFIAASNAMNGPVFVAAVIEREEWEADISFVGHQNTIQVAAFNPRLFFRQGDEPGRATASSMLALGADDFSISIWRNTMHKPLVVLQDIFSRPLLDLCWANDGYHLYGCSADGTICALSFEPAEFPELAELSTTELVLKQYNYRPAVTRAQRVPPPPPRPLDPTPNAPANGFGAPAIGGASHVNVLQPKKGKPAGQKRRINLGGTDRPAARNPFSSPGGANGGDAFSSAPIQPLGSPLKARNAMFNDDTGGFSSDMNGAGPSRLGYKRKADFGDDDSRQGLGQSVQSTIAAKDLREPRFPTSHAGPGPSSRSLPLPRVQTILRVSATYPCDPTAYLEAQNAESASGRNKVLYSQGGQDQWVDYLPSAVIVMVATDRFTAVGCEDGSLVVCSLSGTHLMDVKLPALPVELVANSGKLAVLTSDCRLKVYDLSGGLSMLSTSISHLLDGNGVSDPVSPLGLVKLGVCSNGAPIVFTSEPSAFIFDRTQDEWATASSPWQLDYQNSSQAPPLSTGPLGDLDREMRSRYAKGKSTVNGANPEHWDEIMLLSYLENRTRIALLMDSGAEYRHYVGERLSAYEKGNSRARLDDLIRELLGPVSGSKGNWSPTVGNLKKRDILRDLLADVGDASWTRPYRLLLETAE